jgi:carboxyl-terminal processing protease
MFKKRITLKTAVLIALFTFIIGLGTQVLASKAETNWGILYQVLGIIRTQFVEKDIPDDQLIYGAVRGMLKALDDPYTRFVDPKGFEEMQIHLNGNFTGIGIQIGIKDDQLTVISPIEDTPAAKSGLKALDKIISINGKSTEDMSIEQAVSLIRGPKGSRVTLTIQRGTKNKPKDYTMLRETIKLKAVYKKKMLDDKNKIGYIYLSTFESKESYQEMVDALKELDQKGMKSLILDLRNNGGGLLDEAIQIASIFIKDGAVVHTVDRYGNKETFEVVDTQYTWYDKPIVVLVNGGSASASEILSGAILDDKRGILLGTKTFGKASVQNIRPLSDGSAVLVTVQKYQTPSGTNINKIGITPNITVEIPTATIEEALNNPNYEYKEEKDNQLLAAEVYLRKLKK